VRTQQIECISNVIIVLGKRLVCDQLTEEGISRVDALPELLERFDADKTALVFCGGVTEGQTVSEAEAMFERYEQLNVVDGARPRALIIENESTNTIENVQNAAIKLIESGVCTANSEVKVCLVSNDYHLKRLFQIQRLMNEQGLIKVLVDRCQAAGLLLRVELDESEHCSVTYPHQGRKAAQFLALDELTVYRVYLEGAVSGKLTQPLGSVRQEPYKIAKRALEFLLTTTEDMASRAQITLLDDIVTSTDEQVSKEELNAKLSTFHKELTALNRLLDPESGQQEA
tara:strand:+ start:1793 stop:2650 length:858 start_codon:yes stop_codon:yes gene_type:complete